MGTALSGHSKCSPMPDAFLNSLSDVQRVTAHPDWIPLFQAPFRYRYDPGVDGPILPNGYSDKELKAFLRGPGIREVEIDVKAGEFELSFVENVASPFNFPLRFHPAEFPDNAIRIPEVRASIAENVELAWRIMREDFCCAVQAKRCAVFGRVEKLSNLFTLVAPDVFLQMAKIDWLSNKAQAGSGEIFYSLHVAPPHIEYGAMVVASPGQAFEPTPQRRRAKPISKEREAAKAAFEDLKQEGVPVEQLSNARLIKRIAGKLKEKGHDVPSNTTILRAIDRRS